MKNIKHLVLSLWLFACLLIGFVQAQTEFTTYQDPQQAFSIAYPADWQVVPETDAVSIDADEDTGFYIYAEPLGPEDLEDFVSLTPSTLMDMTLAGMRQEIPDLQVVETNEVTVDGFPAMALRFNATDQATQVSLTGRLVVFASEDHFFILASVSDVASYPQVEPVLEEMHASFTLAPDEPPVDDDPMNRQRWLMRPMIRQRWLMRPMIPQRRLMSLMIRRRRRKILSTCAPPPRPLRAPLAVRG